MHSPFYLTPIPFVKNLKKDLFQNEHAKRKLQAIFVGKTIIDIGCGIEEDAKDVLELCFDFKAGKYLGVDIQSENEVKTTVNKTKIEIIRNDILEYLRNSDIVNDQKVFVFFGLEPVNPEAKGTKKHISKIMNLISQKSRINDIILIGNGTHGINPENYNFLKSEVIQFGKFIIKQYVKQA